MLFQERQSDLLASQSSGVTASRCELDAPDSVSMELKRIREKQQNRQRLDDSMTSDGGLPGDDSELANTPSYIQTQTQPSMSASQCQRSKSKHLQHQTSRLQLSGASSTSSQLQVKHDLMQNLQNQSYFRQNPNLPGQHSEVLREYLLQ